VTPIFAQPDLAVNWSTTVKVALGLIGILTVAFLVFGVALQWKKLFGRRPPIKDELDKLEKRLHEEIIEAHGRAISNTTEAKALALEAKREASRLAAEALDAALGLAAEARKEIRRVEEIGRHELEDRFVALGEERRRHLENLTAQFTFIRENLAAINTELKIRNEK
jgi:hypothetical protein